MIVNPRRRLIVEQLQSFTPASGVIYQRALEVFAGGIVGGDAHRNPWPTYIDHADGAYIWDVDGNRYLDCYLGAGAILFGHSHPHIQQAINDQTKKMIMHTSPSLLQVEAAEKLAEMFPCAEKLFFCNSGSEAMLRAIFLARAYTQKNMIAKFDGCYHGTYDQCCVSVLPSGDAVTYPEAIPMIAGISQRALDDTLVLPFNNRIAFELIEKNVDQLAAVIVEPISTGSLYAMDQAFLVELRELTARKNIPLIFDEVLTGFRIGYGGCQAYFDVTPDIAAYGKVLGGGTAVGAMGCMNYLLRGVMNANPPLRLGGTFSGNPISMAATVATLQLATQNSNIIFSEIDKKCRYFAETLNSKFASTNLPVIVSHFGSMYCVRIAKEGYASPHDFGSADGKKQDELCLRLRLNGVYADYSRGSFSTAHTDSIIEELIEKFYKCTVECFS